MGVLNPTQNELEYLRRSFEEKIKLYGIDALYFEVKDYNFDDKRKYDFMEHFKDPLEIQVLFEAMPTPRTLRNLHWWDDYEGSTPPIAYIPYHLNRESNYLLKPSQGARIDIKDMLGGGYKPYEIQEINANSLFSVYFIVKLTPLREEMKLGTQPLMKPRKGGAGYELINK